jgi:CheY-like chemotaxis protein
LARKILLADDSVTAQNMGRRILTDAGYDVTTVNNGSAALKKIAESLPEIIVLDVYMPGYSGLEVCQRLKETRETARIPVLLTVGKLEPFKPEEARRARADAFIVKPFEASELLTALTKLEDKIVPQPSAKSGQFAKVWAELEQGPPDAPGKSEKFGDAETGWKNRLIIPTPGAKQAEPEPEPEEASSKSKGKKDKKAKEEPKPMEVKASHEVAGVPADITPEEVAAIAAAAAAFEEKNQPPAEFAVKKSEISEEPAAVAAVIQPEKAEEKLVEVEAQAKESAPAPEASTALVTEAPKPVEAIAEVKPAEPTADTKEMAAPEVTATEPAIAEAMPAPQATTEPSLEASRAVEEKPAEVVAAVAATPAVPRWVAQEVPIPPAEVGISLEQEMQKANAVLQAATAMVDLSAMAVEPPKPVAVEQSPIVEAPAPEPPAVEAKAEETKPEEIKTEEKVQEAVPEVVAAAPAPEPERPQEPAAVVSQPEPQAEVVTAIAAAAAAAGTSAPEASKTEAVSQIAPVPVAGEPTVAASEPAAHESELAAAWAQWKQIRETVVGSQLTSQIAEVAAAELKNIEPVPASFEERTPEKSSANPTAIASIVDSVLAELKPRLLEEIAKKLGDEQSKKK